MKSVQMSRDLHARTKEFAQQHDRTVTSIVAEAVSDWLDTVGAATTEILVEQFEPGETN